MLSRTTKKSREIVKKKLAHKTKVTPKFIFKMQEFIMVRAFRIEKQLL